MRRHDRLLRELPDRAEPDWPPCAVKQASASSPDPDARREHRAGIRTCQTQGEVIKRRVSSTARLADLMAGSSSCFRSGVAWSQLIADRVSRPEAPIEPRSGAMASVLTGARWLRELVGEALFRLVSHFPSRNRRATSGLAR